jgi:hypothetical protein
MHKIITPLLCFCLPALAGVHTTKDLDRWSEELRVQYGGCHKLNAEISKMSEGDEENEHFTKKEVGLKALSLLGTVPARSDANKNLYRAILSTEGSPSKADIPYFWNTKLCTPEMKYYSVLSRLLRGVGKLDFSEKEKTVLTATTLRVVRESIDTPNTLIGVLMQSALVNLLADKKLVQANESQTQRLSEIGKELELIRDEIRALDRQASVQYPENAGNQKFESLEPALRDRFLREVKHENARLDPVRKRLYQLAVELKR